jgi:hypothetical protein
VRAGGARRASPAEAVVPRHAAAVTRTQRSQAHCRGVPAYVSIRQQTSAYASIRQHTPAYVSIRLKHTCGGIESARHTEGVPVRQNGLPIKPHDTPVTRSASCKRVSVGGGHTEQASTPRVLMPINAPLRYLLRRF